ncbi:MAG TPA: tRNA-specific adenosine deaminase [Balneola sp.]|jgi:tRNA(adenine34) deaminase|nr:tRNA-specific adenosine deaminase [Bacteroidota bacterium]MAC04197.1 tRNA-specific adenosine deaminase [Balneola sp.]MAO78212.1 tRNA-specific adenosine deaminase [Balneola sp.]MBF64213.1 tRNA-specific adenosine deaminase [Balneola sp.]HAW81147.1 tRNA-specific adenosine deaminase [Balneola sp.]|tara:strand:+ start:9150 stop:9623 length:474 start_codon:yes stop_codon:yes gene_type:complete
MKENNPVLWNTHQQFMAKALVLAEQALEEGEIPVGAVVVMDNRIIGKGYNQVEKLSDPTAHAEMLAISAACETLGNKYLNNCKLYVTLEPCAMCAGALVWSKIDTVIFGASDPKSGGSGSLFNITQNKNLNHQIEVIQGVLEIDSEYLLKSFFKAKR